MIGDCITIDAKPNCQEKNTVGNLKSANKIGNPSSAMAIGKLKTAKSDFDLYKFTITA
jgi:hypothetical protein